MQEAAGDLNKISISSDVSDQTDLGSVDMPVRKMFQYILESENLQFLFQQFSTLRANSFQVFNRICQYGRQGGNRKCFIAKIVESD